MSRPWLKSEPEKEIPPPAYRPAADEIPDSNFKVL